MHLTLKVKYGSILSMKNQKPVYVSGYIRNPKQSRPNRSDEVFATLVISSVIILILVLCWKATLTVAAIISLAVFAKKYYRFANDPNRLVVNYFGQSVADRVRNNLKDMLREQLHA